MIKITDIRSLSEFQRNAKAVLQELKATGRPQILTINGKAEFVIQDAESYQRLLDLLERAGAIEGIRRGLADAKAGRVKPFAAALDQIRRKRKKRRGA